MFKFLGITGYDQLEIAPQSACTSPGAGDESSKWAKQKKEVFSTSDTPKIQVTQRHVFAIHQNSVIVLDTKPLTDAPCDTLSLQRREHTIKGHSSLINCFAVDEETLLLCSCCDETVRLSKWDSLLGHWDSHIISEGEKKALSCSVAFKGCDIFVSVFKWDHLIVYKVTSAHSAKEPGPFVLTEIEMLCGLAKVQEMTTWSRSFFFQDTLHIIGVASGNTVSVKIWEAVCEKGQWILKLKSHRMVSYLKAIAAADVSIENNSVFVLVVGNDGSSEMYTLTPDAFILLYRFRIEDPSVAVSSTGNVPMMNLESRVLSSKIFAVKFPEEVPKEDTSELILDEGGGGDAKFQMTEFDKLSEEEKNGVIGDYAEPEVKLCPKLVVAATTTKGVLFVDVVSGQTEQIVSHGELLKDDTIFIQSAQMSANPVTREIIVGLQSCLTRVVFSRRFKVDFHTGPEESTKLSLIPREALNPKSVLRKKIKSPPRQAAATAKPKANNKSHAIFRVSGGNMPSWARSRSRPSLKAANSKNRLNEPATARSHTKSTSSESGKSYSISSTDIDGYVKVPASGSYEADVLDLETCKKIEMPSSLSTGQSVLRIAATTSGKHLAFGGNLSPLIVTKTRPFQTTRIYKDIGKVSGLHFNFNGDLLLIASSDCRTALVSWQTYRELLSFEFTSKFNEHVHSQFYFMDKFIVQPEENKLVLYSYAKRDTGYIKLKAGEYQLECQTITALAAANQFYSNMIITGQSNKSIQIFDTNAETVSVTIPNTHMKPISCIRLNEAPKGPLATHLCDIFLTSSFSNLDPIKLWDTRSAKCVMRISDVNQPSFVATARPGLSPCGRYICSGFEDGSLTFYDVRRVKHRLWSVKKVGTTVLDCMFDATEPMVWCGCRNGQILNYYMP